jgi:predicted dehydrogenase
MPHTARYSPLRVEVDPDRPVRVAIIGTGIGAAVHIPVFRQLEGTEIVAIGSRRIERAKEIANRHRIELPSDDYREIVDHPDVDAVVIATPPYLHHTIGIAAIEAGKHVLCEKPMARNLAEARDMVNLARTAQVAAVVNHEYRYMPARRHVKTMIDDGFIGEPQSASVVVYRSSLADPNGRPFSWLMEREKAGGMLAASGSHYIDLLRWWFGDIKAVAGLTATMVPHRHLPDSAEMAHVDADDNFSLMLRFQSGAIATIHVSATAVSDAGEEITLSGSNGMLLLQGDGALWGARTQDAGLYEIDIPRMQNRKMPEFAHILARPTALLAMDWVSAIRTGEMPEHVPTFEDGARVQEIIDGVHRSSAQGRWIDTSGARWPISRGF